MTFTATRRGQVYFDINKARADCADYQTLELGKLLNQFSSAQAKTPSAKTAPNALGWQIGAAAAGMPIGAIGVVQDMAPVEL